MGLDRIWNLVVPTEDGFRRSVGTCDVSKTKKSPIELAQLDVYRTKILFHHSVCILIMFGCICEAAYVVEPRGLLE